MVLNRRVLNSEFSVVKCLPELLEQEVACRSPVLGPLPCRHVQMDARARNGGEGTETIKSPGRTRKVALDLERTGQLGRPENEESMGVAMAMEEAGNRIVGSVFRHLV